MRSGILGGTFNPIHTAHLQIAEEVLQALQLDRVIFIPAAVPPHKDVAGDVPFHHRMAMVKAAIKGNDRFQVSDLEIRRSGKSFSVDTLEVLHSEFPDDVFYFIIGLDSYRDLALWKNFEQLFSLCHLVVTYRPDVDIADPLAPLPVAMHKHFCYDEKAKKIRHKSGNYVHFLSETQLDISSTDIRQRLYRNQPVQDMIPPAVADYITRHHLYQSITHTGS